MERLRASLLAVEAVLGSRAKAWEAVLAAVEDPDAEQTLEELASWCEPGAVAHLADVHESMLATRNESGSFYTPPALVGWVLDRALATTGVPRVLDPACGAGHFLVAVAERLIARGIEPAAAVAAVHGTDLDPIAVAITRLRLRQLAPGSEPRIRVADGLEDHPGAPYDVVVGNPPFLGQLRTRTSQRPVPGFGAYTDTSAIFLAHSLRLVRPGGIVALVQPLSLLAARDAAPVRARVREQGALTAFWASTTPVFADAAVTTCAPIIRVGAHQGEISTWHGPDFVAGPSMDLPDDEWGQLVAPALGIPAVRPHTAGTLADLGSCTADFRDQYYGLIPFVRDGGPGVPLITSGLIDPAAQRWGTATTRFAKTSYDAPTVDLDALHAQGDLSAWATSRLVPKVLVATQGRVIEAVVDEVGAWLPSVPVLTFTPLRVEDLWRVLAVLLAPPVVALAAARYVGTAMSPTAIKLSARQVLELPLPGDTAAWARGAELARTAQSTEDDAGRTAVLAQLGETMSAAYDDHGALAWWLERVQPRRR